MVCGGSEGKLVVRAVRMELCRARSSDGRVGGEDVGAGGLRASSVGSEGRVEWPGPDGGAFSLSADCDSWLDGSRSLGLGSEGCWTGRATGVEGMGKSLWVI